MKNFITMLVIALTLSIMLVIAITSTDQQFQDQQAYYSNQYTN